MVDLIEKTAPPQRGKLGAFPGKGGAYWCSAAGERFEGSQKKRRPFRATPAVLAARRLDDSRVGVDPH
jgi:hypothetical protein